MTHPRALIIDDNPSDRALALREIKKVFFDFQYWEIINETDFAQSLQKQQFNLVITDYQLRWTTGLDVLYRVKKQTPSCPVIMFTGTGSEEIAVKAMKGGLDDYVIKSPKHYIRLAAAVKSAWARSRDRQALIALKQTYDRFFEQIPLGLYRLNPSGEVEEANSTLAKIIGYSHQRDLIGKNLLEYHIKPELYSQWKQQLALDNAIETFEGQIRTIKDELIWVRHNTSAVKNEKGQLVCYEGAIADITSNKQAELERIELLNRERKAKEEAEQLNRIKDEFLATLSHELRTPLNSIIGWTQILRNKKISQAQIDNALEVINRNANAQNRLIDDLLDVSRIVRGQVRLQLQPVNIVEVLTSSLETVRPTAEAKNITIDYQLNFSVAEVNADVERLEQVFWNILTNAIKFTPSGGSITVKGDKTNNVLIQFTDTGQGITPDVLPYIFDRFRQAEIKSSTRTKGGLGLGLAIVRHLIEIHGGSITAYSAGLGKGATFSLQLPLFEGRK